MKKFFQTLCSLAALALPVLAAPNDIVLKQDNQNKTITGVQASDVLGMKSDGKVDSLPTGVINVKWLSAPAVGDGTTDDTTAFQTAITSACSTGVPVFVPTGTYLISSTLAVSANTNKFSMYGAGRNSTILKCRVNGASALDCGDTLWLDLHDFQMAGDSSSGHAIRMVDPTYNSGSYLPQHSLLQRLYITGFGGADVDHTGAAMDACGVFGVNALNTDIRDCVIASCDIGTYFFDSYSTTIAKTAYSTNSKANAVDHRNENSSFDNNDLVDGPVTSSTFNLVAVAAISGSAAVPLSNLVVIDTHNFVAKGNKFKNAYNQIYSSSRWAPLITENWIRNDVQNGILSLGPSRIIGNTFYPSYLAGSATRKEIYYTMPTSEVSWVGEVIGNRFSFGGGGEFDAWIQIDANSSGYPASGTIADNYFGDPDNRSNATLVRSGVKTSGNQANIVVRNNRVVVPTNGQVDVMYNVAATSTLAGPQVIENTEKVINAGVLTTVISSASAGTPQTYWKNGILMMGTSTDATNGKLQFGLHNAITGGLGLGSFSLWTSNTQILRLTPNTNGTSTSYVEIDGGTSTAKSPIYSVLNPAYGSSDAAWEAYNFRAGTTSAVSFSGLGAYLSSCNTTTPTLNYLYLGPFATPYFTTSATAATLPGTLAVTGAVTGASFNGNTITTGTGTLTLAAGKTLTASNTLTLAGTDATVLTFPTTSATIARTDAANTFTGASTGTSWTLTTPTLSGTTTAGAIVSSSTITAGAGSGFTWSGRSTMRSPSDGLVGLYNSATTDFGRLQLGGTTSSFPAIKRSGTSVAIRLADDSADAPLTASTINGDTITAPAADAGANDTYVATPSPALTAYTTGAHYRFMANTANTGAATVNLNSLGAKTIKKAAGGITTDLADNDIWAGQWVDLVYDGTNMQMQSTLGARPVEFGVALSDETTDITTGTAVVTMRAPYAFTLTSVRASVNTVSSSGIPTVDINETGTTVLSTKLTIDASELTSVTAAAAAVISDSAIADDAELTFDIDVAGTGAKGLKVWLYGYR